MKSCLNMIQQLVKYYVTMKKALYWKQIISAIYFCVKKRCKKSIIIVVSGSFWHVFRWPLLPGILALPLSVARLCDLLLKDRLQQQWCNVVIKRCNFCLAGILSPWISSPASFDEERYLGCLWWTAFNNVRQSIQ